MKSHKSIYQYGAEYAAEMQDLYGRITRISTSTPIPPEQIEMMELEGVEIYIDPTSFWTGYNSQI